MFLMGVLAGARWAPRVDVETFSPWQPPLAQLFRSSRNESKASTLALFAVVL